MLSRNALRQVARPAAASRMAVRFSGHVAHPANWGVAVNVDANAKLQEAQSKAQAEGLKGDALSARVKHLLAQDNITLYHPKPEEAQEYISDYEHTREHGAQTAGLWRKISIFVFIPAFILTSINTYFVEKEHAEHRAHAAEHPDEEKVFYPYQKLLIKDFFWGTGNKSVFWNDTVNHNREE